MIHTSVFWKNHFADNLTKQHINWKHSPELSDQEKSNILYSLKAWQLGETSEGTHLLVAAQKYSKRIKDEAYVDAVKLFIREEQKHGANLGRYIDLIGEQRFESVCGIYL